LPQEREAKEKIHILASGQKIKGGSERTTREGEDERSIFGVPLIVFCFNKLINNYNGVNTVFLSYKSCIFSLISALRVHTKINLQIFRVEAPAWQGAKEQ
jgi:hypothetical protein